MRKKDKAFLLLEKLKPDFNLMDFTKRQRELEYRIDDIKKAIEFAVGQIEEARQVLEEADEVLNVN